MLIFILTSTHETSLGLVLKTTRFNDSEATLSFERDNNFTHGALSDLQLYMMISFTLHAALKDHIQ